MFYTEAGKDFFCKLVSVDKTFIFALCFLPPSHSGIIISTSFLSGPENQQPCSSPREVVGIAWKLKELLLLWPHMKQVSKALVPR